MPVFGLSSSERFGKRVREKAEAAGFDQEELDELERLIKEQGVGDVESLIKALDKSIEQLRPVRTGKGRQLGGTQLQILARARKKLDSLSAQEILG